MIQRYRLKHDLTSCSINYVQAYCIDSEKEEMTHYLTDGEQLAIARHNDMIIWNIPESKAAAEIFIDPIKREILEVYQEVKELIEQGVKLC